LQPPLEIVIALH